MEHDHFEMATRDANRTMEDGSVEINNKDSSKKTGETECGKRKKKQEQSGETSTKKEDDQIEWGNLERGETPKERKEAKGQKKHVKIHF